jgi:hypothetical protein
MENQITDKAFYRSIGRVWSPQIDDHIMFNNIGFRHLIWKGRRRRSYRDQHGKKIIKTPSANFWEFTGERDNKTIIVIVRQIKSGRKHFFSVYDE